MDRSTLPRLTAAVCAVALGALALTGCGSPAAAPGSSAPPTSPSSAPTTSAAASPSTGAPSAQATASTSSAASAIPTPTPTGKNLAEPLPGSLGATPDAALFASDPSARSLSEHMGRGEVRDAFTVAPEASWMELMGTRDPGAPVTGIGGPVTPGTTVRLLMVCADPDSGPSSLGVLVEEVDEDYRPLGWSDRCGGYSVTVPASYLDGDVTFSYEVPDGVPFRVAELEEEPAAKE